MTGPRVHKATLARVAPTPTAGRIVFPPKELLKFYPAVPVQKQGLCRCDQVKMRSCWIKIALQGDGKLDRDTKEPGKSALWRWRWRSW